ncbi:monosaccharide ABC transporter membrane protein, CUT2 family [Micromonospora rhizosphaerae]|uniref:Monosaccharide ABC transporter membrane protein, CUT2 family n=1 Tax=Micromonospora rhizosphaerae TaxID=568872 RepID=A0A1C6RCH7_9ACTN|nr:ABC transporter permease [Micromonospora rhizosphaerae]SCL14715.1 monosaccharide ABC transporter membrane protein, CUT2 family [Micromonospora rhizosphaerae]
MGYDETGRGGLAEPPSGVPAAVLENVFDDPLHGEPGRDRIAVHVVWEILLLVGLAALTFLLWREDADALRGGGLRSLLVDVVALGLLALAAGLSLRAAAVNLAVGPVAVAAALHFAEQGDRGVREAVLPALLVAALGGLALALAVVVLHVPGWAASLAGAAGVIVYIERRAAPVVVQGGYDPRSTAFHLFVGFAAVAVLGGLFGAVKAIRRLVGRFRPVADPARRRGGVAAMVTALALVGSTVLAMLAGVLIAANGAGPVAPVSGLDWSVLAIGTAMLAGTSAYGRRGGVFGTLIAVSLVVVFLSWAQAHGWTVSRWAVGGAALGAGLLVTRLVEALGRPREVTGEVTESGPAGDGTISAGWSLGRSGTVENWSPVLPVRTTETTVDPWEAPRWETDPQRWDADDR